MYELRAVFSDEHKNSAKELSKIIRDQWPVIFVLLRDETNTLAEYKTVNHSCSTCDLDSLKAGLTPGYRAKHRERNDKSSLHSVSNSTSIST